MTTRRIIERLWGIIQTSVLAASSGTQSRNELNNKELQQPLGFRSRWTYFAVAR
jgi:hypothetical protein